MSRRKHNIRNSDTSGGYTALELHLMAVVAQQQAVIAQQQATIARQEARIAALEKEVVELRAQLARALKNSSTSSKPPSSDIVKPSPPPSFSKRKPGGQPGHVKYNRLPFEASSIAAVHRYTLVSCPDCHRRVRLIRGSARVLQQVEVGPAKVQVEEHQGEAYWCDPCQKVVYAPLPDEVEKAGLIGPELTAQIAYMKSAMHASFSTIQTYLRDVLGLTVSRGYLSKLIRKVSAALEQPYTEVQTLLRSEPVVNVDETGHNDNGRRHWTWCFRTTDFTVFKVSPTRGSEVLFDVLGAEFEGVLGCDYFSAYRKYMRACDIRVQFCLAHLIRDLKFLTTLPDMATVAYGHRLLEDIKTLFMVIHLHDELSSATATKALLSVARDRMVANAQRHVPKGREAQCMARRFKEYGAAYFEFITTPEIEPTNNLAEQAIRFVTIDRHITQGTRSEGGRQWCERIWTVLATCTRQEQSAFNYLVAAVNAYFKNQPSPSLLYNHAPP